MVTALFPFDASVPCQARARYSTCGESSWPSGILGCRKSPWRSRTKPSRSISRRDRSFTRAVNDSTSGRCSSAKAWWSACLASSYAMPRPQCSRASLQPISTHGVNAASKAGTARPVKPANTPSTSTAHRPQPPALNQPALTSRKSVALRPRERAGKVAHDFGIGIHHRKRRQVGILPLSQADLHFEPDY